MKTFKFVRKISAILLSLSLGIASVANVSAYGGGGGGGGGTVGKCGGTNTPAFSEITPARNSIIDVFNSVGFTISGFGLDSNKVTITVNDVNVAPQVGTQLDGTLKATADVSGLNIHGTTKVAIGATSTKDCTRTVVYFVQVNGGSDGTNLPGGGGTIGGDIIGHWAEGYINTLIDKGVMNGDAATGDLRPNDPTNRAEFVAMMIRLFGLSVPSTVSAKPFPDVDINAWYAPHLVKAQEMGWINGYGSKDFRPAQKITRAEAVKILVLAFGVAPTGTNSGFPDVPSYAWYAPYIAWAKNNGIVLGYADGTFKPDNLISRGEVAKIIVKAIERFGL